MGRRVKIVDGGHVGMNTTVSDSETGRDIPYCYAYEIKGNVGEATKAVIYCWSASIDYEGNAEVVTTCPTCHSTYQPPMLPLMWRVRNTIRRIWNRI